jgi:SAM-dependent methyltransferase
VHKCAGRKSEKNSAFGADLNTEDRLDFIRRYEKRLEEYGYSPETLGWGVHGRQEVRFAVLAEFALQQPNSSVLDVGCGFCDLYEFLTKHEWRGHYTGVDVVPGLLSVARQRHPSLDVRELDITDQSAELDEYDFVIASGIFNAALPSGTNASNAETALRRMFQHSRVATCVDFLSSYVDFQKPGAYHTDPAWAFSTAKRLTRSVLLRHDYMPYEFSVFLFRDEVSDRNVFRFFEDKSDQRSQR